MSYLSVLVAFLAVITLTISQNINPNYYHQIHDGLISNQPPPTRQQLIYKSSWSQVQSPRGPNQHQPRHIPPPPQVPRHPPIQIPIPGIPNLQPRRPLRPPPKM
ncbi:unnamed protein product [Trifolium pratense]|uniref:Uncharacterized protein n=1 Tax=Trifolium pratense TaxID=57577 RepID=A0ACB0IXA4_TRIPR|nr:unnamed protein product [Trifolium pratense]